MSNSPPSIISIAVIGAGPCGLAAAKYLLAENAFSKVRVFEQRNTVGGIWTHTSLHVLDAGFTVPRTQPTQSPDTAVRVEGQEGAQFVSPVYDFLETNIPHSLMNYSDQTFPSGCSLFPSHQVVKKYMDDYAAELAPVLSLSTQILSITKPDGQAQWKVDTLNLKTGARSSDHFDAVLVASGHYNDPFIPDIPGLAEFHKAYPGSISHSKFYRNPTEYSGKKVVVVGNSASGIDLSAQISTVCKKPILVSEKNTPNTPSEDDPSKKLVPEIKQFSVVDRSVQFANGEVETNIDAVVFCTGYFYSYPFLAGLSPPVNTDGSCAHRLYEHVLYIDDPTLAFVGIPQRVVPFPVAEVQAAWVSRIWAGRLSVPPVESMEAWEKQMLEERGVGKALHNMGFPQDVAYINKLHDASLAAKKKTQLANEGEGKIPPYWDEEKAWIRERFPLIKLASRKLGDRKHEVKSVADLGFDFQAWKASEGK